jgi:uncharacterized protein
VKGFFDTNVLISAHLKTQGICSKLIESVLSEESPHHFVISTIVFQEYERKLKERFRVPSKDIQFALAKLEKYEIVPTPLNPSIIQIRDPDDAFVLASALEAEADILVTGDKDLLTLGDTAGIKIVDPRKLWEMLEKQ